MSDYLCFREKTITPHMIMVSVSVIVTVMAFMRMFMIMIMFMVMVVTMTVVGAIPMAMFVGVGMLVIYRLSFDPGFAASAAAGCTHSLPYPSKRSRFP